MGWGSLVVVVGIVVAIVGNKTSENKNKRNKQTKNGKMLYKYIKDEKKWH